MTPIRYLLAGTAIWLALTLYPLFTYPMATSHQAPLYAAKVTSLPPVGPYRTLSAYIDRPVTLDTYTHAFYSSWAFTLEGWITDATHHHPTLPPSATPNGRSHVRGRFAEIYRDDTTLAVWWSGPGGAGAQFLSVSPRGSGSEISYTCAEVDGDKLLFRTLLPLHLLYMRYLFDHARQVLVQS